MNQRTSPQAFSARYPEKLYLIHQLNYIAVKLYYLMAGPTMIYRILESCSPPERSSEKVVLSGLVGLVWRLSEMGWQGKITLPCLSVLGDWWLRHCLHTMHSLTTPGLSASASACGAVTLVFPWHCPYVYTRKYPLLKPHASCWNRGHCTVEWHDPD